MSLISKFITDHLVTALENNFIAHEPELQEKFVEEVRALSKLVEDWVISKVKPAVAE